MRTPGFADLAGIGATPSFSLELRDILAKTCQSAVEAFGVDHSGVVLFDPEGKKGRVESEYPAWNLVGRVIPLQGIPDEEELIRTQRPVAVANIEKRKSLGSTRELLLARDIKSILLVPLVSKGRVLGSFSLDISRARREFAPGEIKLCQIFAERVVVAVENAQLFEEAKLQTSHLEDLRSTSLAVSSIGDRNVLLNTIVKMAVSLMKGKSGGIYEYLPDRDELIVIADYNRPAQIGKTLKSGEGIAGFIVQNKEPYMIVPNYNSWPGRARIYKNSRLFGSVIEVPLRWQEKTIGVLYVDDEVGRVFTLEDAHWLGLFADQAAVALVNSNFIAMDEEKVRRLEKLSRGITEIMSLMGRTSLDELLELVAMNAVGILEAEACAVLLLKRDGILSLEASFGHREGGFRKGKEFVVTSGPKAGLTGHIAYEGNIFNSWGSQLRNHFAVKGGKTTHLRSGKCHSLLAIPLTKSKNSEQRLVGLLRIDNKLKDGRVFPGNRFDQEDEWILSILAEAVVVAIENARILNELSEQKHHQTRLISSAPDCIIAVDKYGNITDYNERAEHVLGYTRDEVLEKNVGFLYADPKEPRRIGRRLRAAYDGRLTNYEATIKSKNEQLIPIRLSATWLYNHQGKLKGNVGYFEDLTYAQETERVHHEAQIIARTSTLGRLDRTLHAIVRGAKNALRCDVATLYTFDEKSNGFVHGKGIGCIESKHMTPPQKVTKDSDLWKIIDLKDTYFHVTEDVLADPFSRGAFIQAEGIRSFIGIQLRSGNNRVGVLFIDYRELHTFNEVDINNALYFGNQAATAILNAQLVHEIKRQANLLSTLYDAVTGSRPLNGMLGFIAKQALRLTGVNGDYGGFSHLALIDGSHLFFKAAWPLKYLPGLEWGIGDIDLDNAKPLGLTGLAARSGMTINVGDVNSHSDYICYDESTVSELVVPIKHKNKIMGVINVERHDGATFSKMDEEAIEYLAAQAALAIQTAIQYEQTLYNSRLRKGLLEIGRAIMSLGDPKGVLQTLVEGMLEALGCDLVTLYTYNEADQSLGDATSSGVVIGSEDLNDIGPSSMVRELLGSRVAHFADMSAQDRLLSAGGFVDRQKIRSSAGIPLLIGKESVGIVFVNYRKPHVFKSQEREDLKLFATQAAMAIGNARLFEASEKRAQNLDAVLRLSRAVNLSLDLDEILTIACKSAVELVKVDHSALVLFDADQNKGEIRAEYPEIGTRGSIIQIRGVSIEERLIATKQSCVINDVEKEIALDPAREILANVNTSAVAFVPIISKAGVIGSFGLDVWGSPRAFAQEDIHLCEIFASQVALAIENAQREYKLDSVHRFSQTVNSTISLAQVFGEACKAAVQLLGVDHAGIVQFDESQEIGTIRAEYPPMDMEGMSFPLRGVPSEEQLIRVKKPLMITDVPHEPGLNSVRNVLVKLDTQSILIVPILSKGQILGSFGVDAIKCRRAFTEQEIELLQIFAEQVGMAIQNAQLFDERTTKLGEQESLVRLSEALLGTVTLQEALSQAVTVAANILHSEFCDIVLAEEDGNLFMHAGYGWEEDLVGTLKLDPGTGSQSGYTIMSKGPVVVDDYADESRFAVPAIVFDHSIKSGMSVPLFRSGQVIGAMLVHTTESRRYSEPEVNVLSLVANQTAIAIQSAKHQAELMGVQEQLAAQSALDWMRIAGSTWAHAVTTAAIVIKENADAINQGLSDQHISDIMLQKLQRVHEQAQGILDMRITVPLSAEVGTELVGVNAFLRERIPRICMQRGEDVTIAWELHLQDVLVMKVSPEWFKRAVDILVDNAIEAMAECQTKILTIATAVHARTIEIAIKDNGVGIPPEKQGKLFHEPLPSATGMGTGLMLAAKIVQTFQGRVRLGSSDGTGTTMVISLPRI